MPKSNLRKFDLIQISPELKTPFAGCLMVVLDPNLKEGVFGYFEVPFLIEDPEKRGAWYDGMVTMHETVFVCKNGRPRAYWMVPNGQYEKVGTLSWAPEEEGNQGELYAMGFTSQKLKQLTIADPGDIVECLDCGQDHKLRVPSEEDLGKMSRKISAYQCGENLLTPQQGTMVYTCGNDVKLGALKDNEDYYRIIAGISPSMST